MAMKNRILFVEDNPVLLQAYALMLRPDAEHWEIGTALEANTALQMMRETPYDVVVSDMALPGKSGLELLVEVRQRYPATARIMVSGLTDQEAVARALGTTHQFISKPVDPRTLRSTLARIMGLEAYLQGKQLQELVARLRAIPSFPSLYLELMKELQREEPSIEKIAQVVQRDPGMMAKMLQVVNSAAFGLPEKTADLMQAVQFLGWSSVRSIVLSFQVFSFFERDRRLPSGFAEALWQHSVRTGALARKIMVKSRAEMADTEDACIAGMLHDIGKLMLAHNLSGQFENALSVAEAEKIPLHEAENRVFGACHASAAAYLLGLWGLPAAIVEAVAFHHTPSRGSVHGMTPLTAVHIANVLEREFSGTAPGQIPSTVDAQYVENLGLQNKVETWRTELRD